MEEVERITKEVVQKKDSPTDKYVDQEKIDRIDREIEEAESAKTVGIILAIGGVALQTTGWLLYDTEGEIDFSSYDFSYSEPDNTVAWICIGAGIVATIWGIYKWIDNANQLALLKAKRYDITFSPSLIPTPDRSFAYGVSLNVTLK